MTSLLVADSKYQFIPPHEGRFWPRLLGRLTPRYLKRKHGITHIEVRGGEIVKELQKSGHRVLLAPNHCRMSDAVVLQSLASSLQQPFYVMASAHLFRGNRLLAWVLRRFGAIVCSHGCCDVSEHSAYTGKGLTGSPFRRGSTSLCRVIVRWCCFPRAR